MAPEAITAETKTSIPESGRDIRLAGFAVLKERTMAAEVVKTRKKTPRSESNHNMNVANFAILINCVKSYDKKYNPLNGMISIHNLEAVKARAEHAIAEVRKYEAVKKNTIRERREAFDEMNILTMRVKNALAVNASKKEIRIAEAYSRRTRGGRNKRLKETTDEKSRLNSQMNYDYRLKYFREFCLFLQGIDSYRPKENNLMITAMKAYADYLGKLNDAAVNAWDMIDNARANRDTILYGEGTGLCELAMTVRKYVRSLFPALSKEYEKVSSIRFKCTKDYPRIGAIAI